MAMRSISVCCGMSCCFNESYDIFDSIEEFIKNNDLENRVELSESRCKSLCNEGVIVRIDNKIYKNVKKNEIIEELNNL